MYACIHVFMQMNVYYYVFKYACIRISRYVFRYASMSLRIYEDDCTDTCFKTLMT